MADVTITIAAGANSVVKKIPDNKLAEFKSGFLAKEPIPQIPDPAWVSPTIPDPQWVDPGDGSVAPQIPDGSPPDLIDKYSQLQHFANIIEAYYKMIYKSGKKKLSNQAAVYDDDVIIDN